MKIVKYRDAIDVGGKGMTNANKVFEQFSKNVTFSKFSEALTLNYIEQALQVYDKALSHKAILDIVVECEGRCPTTLCVPSGDGLGSRVSSHSTCS